MAKTPGKIAEGMPETSRTLIAGEEILFGQPVEIDGSIDTEGNRYDSGNFMGAAVYDPSAGTDDSRRYEQYDPVEVLEKGVMKVRINRDWTIGTTDYYGYLSAGDAVYAVPEGYLDDGRTYFSAAPETFFDGSANSADGAIDAGYFGDPVGKALESTPGEGDKAVIDVAFNQPDVN